VSASACIAFVLFSTAASAQMLPGKWQYSSATQADGRVYFAFLPSNTLMSDGGEAGGYAPVLSVSCKAGDPQHWQLQFSLEDPLTSRGVLNVNITLDEVTTFDSQWVVTGDKRHARKVGVAEVSRLLGARKMKLQWNWGWSWLWLSDEAEFDLADLRTVVFTLAKSCSIPVPG
jgi:hypothetical protein